jgi:capsule polysaccharide export protein KpsE/RkpR
MVEIGVFILADFARNLERNDYLVKNLKVENVYRLHEDFIDAIYGLESHIEKEKWLEKVSESV